MILGNYATTKKFTVQKMLLPIEDLKSERDNSQTQEGLISVGHWRLTWTDKSSLIGQRLHKTP